LNGQFNGSLYKFEDEDKDQEYAKATVDAETAIEKAKDASKAARELRAAISAGNAKEIELDINPELLRS
jgi:hypothetical protein